MLFASSNKKNNHNPIKKELVVEGSAYKGKKSASFELIYLLFPICHTLHLLFLPFPLLIRVPCCFFFVFLSVVSSALWWHD